MFVLSHPRIGDRMNKQKFLNDAIRAIAQRAGIERPVFHITSVSQDSAGIFIMQTMWPEGRLICEGMARAVAAFPRDHYTTCVALLPELVDEIICAARQGDAASDAATAGVSRH